MAEHDGGPAYPVIHQEWSDSGELSEWWLSGMSLRDYFAGQALQGLLAHPGTTAHGDSAAALAKLASEISFQVADAMLEERS